MKRVPQLNSIPSSVKGVPLLKSVLQFLFGLICLSLPLHLVHNVNSWPDPI